MHRTAVLISVVVAAASALTWTNTGDLANALIVRDLSMGPSGRLYAAASTDTTPSGGVATIFHSTDFHNWQSVGTITGVEIITSLVKSNGDTLFAGTRTNGSACLYVSADGLNWASRSAPGTLRFGNTMTCLMQDAGGRLLAGSNYMGMSAAEVYYSDTRGMTWTRPTTMPYCAEHGFLFQAADGNTFCGTVFSAARVMKSTDRGVNWATTSLGGNPKPSMTQSASGKLYVASRSGTTGTVDVSTDGGAGWTTSYTGGSIRSLCRASDGLIYAGRDSVAPDTAEVLVSTDDGATWVSAGRLPGARRIYRIVDVDVSGTHYLYAATGPYGNVLRAPLGPPPPPRDVGVTYILAPTGLADSGQQSVPACSVYNFGATTESYSVRMRIGSAYNQTASVSGHGPGATLYLTFQAWTALERGLNAVRCSTELNGDVGPANNRKLDSIYVNVHDAAAKSIASPGSAVPPGPVVPAATVRNTGTLREPTRVFFSINPSGYVDSVVLSAGLPFSDTTVSFGGWSAVPGNYIARCSTRLAGDQVPANDTVSRAFTVNMVDVGVTAITAPVDTIDTLAPVVPSARVGNFGAAAATFKVFFRISRTGVVYAESTTVASLGSGDSTEVPFPAWPGPHPAGVYATRCSAYLSGDQNALNDTMNGTFTVFTSPPPGWREMTPMPAASSAKPVKDGGWLAYNTGNGIIYAAKGNKTSDFYRYDPTRDSWRLLSPIPRGVENKPPSKGSSGCTDGLGVIYATKGSNTQGFHCYVAATDSWYQLADIPLGPSNKKVKGGTDMAYVPDAGGHIYLLKGNRFEFWRYNVARDSWQQMCDLPSLPYPKWGNGSWLALGPDSVLYAHQAKYHQFFAYDLIRDTWFTNRLAGMPYTGATGKSKKSKDGGCATMLDGYVYALKGGNTQEFWRYNTDRDSWAEKETLPQFGTTGKKKKVKAGGDLTATADYLYALKGNKTLELWRYVPGQAQASSYKPQAVAALGTRSELTDNSVMSLRISPNPLRAGFATVTLTTGHDPNVRRLGSCPKSNPKLSIYDATGRATDSWLLPIGCSSFPLDLRSLPPGVYLLKLTAGSYTATQKLVIQR